MRRLLLLFALLAGRLANASVEDFASPLRFGLDVFYSPIHYNAFFLDPGTGIDASLSQSAAGFYFEWIPITRWGKLGIGAGYQYVFSRTITYSTGDTSSLSANCVEVGLSYRADFFHDQYVVPYGRFALTTVFPHEVTTVGGVETRPSQPSQRGTQIAFGGEVLIDWLEPKSAANLDRDQGINNLFLYGEYIKFTSPTGVASDLSYSGFRAGFRAEF